MNSSVDPTTVKLYLEGRLRVQIDDIQLRRVFPGVSRETWLVTAQTSAEAVGVVLRLDPPWPIDAPMTLETEYAVYAALWKSGIPVAEPLWYAADEDFAGGRPHMVRRLVEGSSTISGLRGTSSAAVRLRESVVHSHLDALASLHTLDWHAAGLDSLLPAPPSPQKALAFEFELWRSRWLAKRAEVQPVVTEFLCWLGENIPTDTPFVAFTKGNNGVGEEIFKDGRLVALSDFELSALTDGALDLAFTQGTLALTGNAAAIKYYERCVGHTVSPQRLGFAMLWNRFKGMACLDMYFKAPFLRGEDPRTTAGAFGLVSVPRVERSLARFIGQDIATVGATMADAGSGMYS